MRVILRDLPPKAGWEGQEAAAKEWLDMVTRAVAYGYKLDLAQLKDGS